MSLRFFCMAVLFAMSPACVMAQETVTPPPFPDFTSKFVKPPKPGVQKRITVQVPPRAEPAIPPRPGTQAAAILKPEGIQKDAPQVVGGYSWFWTQISPKQNATGPGRLAPALVSLSKGPGGQSVPGPRLQDLQEIAATYGKDLLRESVGTRVSPALALAVVAVESSGKSGAISSAGAQGLMQLMPATAQRFGVKDSLDAAQNIRGGIRFLDFLMEKFDNDPILVLAGYNAGENSIAEHDGVPPYAETRDYVPKVLAAYQVARGLCLTPPELISDGCVFRVMTKN
ncbi:MAG: lytic transglycosylase domain-containing protein [Pelagimonas sp.]|nr:lytic transglycosylase domain-containing protein [Pelagimonas sp.]